MQHPDEGTIHAWLDGALSADEAARVEAHVKECQQCEAAVAEARGFIAASSRILTALDDAPRGVIPAAAPQRRIDPMVWRIAATVLVVATGTFVVLNSRSSGYRSVSGVVTATARQQDEATSAPSTADSAIPTTPDANEAAGANSPAAPTVSAPSVERRAKAGPGAVSGVAGGVASRQSVAELSRVAPRRADVAQSVDLAKTPARERGFSAAAPTPVPAPPSPVAAQRSEESRVAETAGLSAKMDAAAEAPAALRIVGRPRAIGQTITLYEVTPGDTVTLVEPMNVELNSVVVTGLSSQVPADGKRARAVDKTTAAAGAQAAAPTAAPVAPSRPPSTPYFTEGANGKNTLTWTDPRTGLRNQLTGRHTRAELEQILSRIERVKAAAADSARKR